MRILQLCNRVPYPPTDGGSIAMFTVTRSLHELGHEVYTLCINTPKHYVNIKKLPADIVEEIHLKAVQVNTSVSLIKAFLNLFSAKSYNVQRFISREFENKLKEVLTDNSFDIVQLESLYLTPYLNCIRKHSKAKIILRAHNVEFKIWERMEKGNINGLKKLYLKILTKRLKNYEVKHINQYDAIVAITPEDEKIFRECGCRLPIHVTPISINSSDYSHIGEVRDNSEKITSIFHLGTMNWMPNEEGIRWFLHEVWNKIYKNYPDLQLYIAGKNMPSWITKNSYPNTTVIEYVDNVKEFIRSKHLMIVPLLSGSGIRVKIIEGMAMGKTVISTTIGAEGINYTNNKNILIADTAEDFNKMINKCINDKSFYKSVGENARVLVKTEYESKNVIQKLVEFYQKFLTS